MADRLQDAAAHLAKRLQAFASRDAVYSRGAVSLDLKASVGSSLLRLSDSQGGTRIQRTQNDYLIQTADLIELGEPEEGDRIFDSLDGKTYEVLSPDPGEAAWRYADGSRIMMRLHTREVSSP